MSAGIDHLDAREVGELRALFFAHAGEMIDQVQDALLSLEGGGAASEALRAAKRPLHTIKGDAGSMGFESPELLCHRLEDVLAAVSADPGRVGAGVEVLLAGADALGSLLADLEAGREAQIPALVTDAIDRFLGAAGAAAAAADGPPELSEIHLLQAREAQAAGLHLHEVAVAPDPRCLERQVGLLMLRDRLAVVGKVIAVHPAPELADAPGAPPFRFVVAASGPEMLEVAASLPGVAATVRVRPWAVPSTGPDAADKLPAPTAAAPGAPAAEAAAHGDMLRVDAAKVDQILDLVGELIIGRSMLEQVARDAAGEVGGARFAERLGTVSAYIERTVGDLQKGALRMRMVPLRSLFKKFPRVVRDLAHQLGKQIGLEIVGQETELDKGIVDALLDPLTHLVRNMAVHGIEDAGARRAAGKPPEGRITLRAYQEAARIVVEVEDDGRGIDTAGVVARAVERGHLDAAAAAALSAEEAQRLIFLHGLSTAESVTATSGRGIGMDVVKSALDALKGSIEIESRPGAGTVFRLRLPMTLAVIRTLLFSAGDRTFAIPVAAIAEVARVHARDLTTVDGRACLLLRDQIVSVIALRELFGLAGAGEGGYVLILALRGRRFGLMVDRLFWQQELVIKSVDSRWVDTGCVAGASILGDGSVVLILDEIAVVERAVAAEKARQDRS